MTDARCAICDGVENLLGNLQDQEMRLRFRLDRAELALASAQKRFEDIAEGRAFQPSLHARTGAEECRAARSEILKGGTP